MKKNPKNPKNKPDLNIKNHSSYEKCNVNSLKKEILK
jgi:hypothetical protein